MKWTSKKIAHRTGLILILVPVLMGAATAEDSRRIEEEKRQQLRASEAVPQRPATGEMSSPIPEGMRRYRPILDKRIAHVKDGKEMVGLLTQGDPSFAREINVADDGPLTRGQLALMLSDTLRIKGGVMLRLLPGSSRYAHRELVHLGVMFPGSAAEYVSGRELVVTTIQAIQYATEEMPR